MSSISGIARPVADGADFRALLPGARIVPERTLATLLAALLAISCSAPPAPPAPKEDPVANAGPDQTVQLGETVLLDAAGSSDPHSEPISYTWSADAENPAPVALTQSVQIQFTPVDPGVYRFALSIQAGERTSRHDSVSVTVLSIDNSPPVVEAGPNLSYSIDAALFLDGSATADPDGDQLSFRWELISGSGSVAIEDSASSQTRFTATAPGSYRFRLTVADEIYSVSDEVTIALTSAGNIPPLAAAGPDAEVTLGSIVTLDGGASSDPDGADSTLTYRWTVGRTPGEAAELTDADSSVATFTAAAAGEYVFGLVVNDGLSDSIQDVVTITVLDQVFSSRAGMTEIPAGEFLMGTDIGTSFDGPPHTVELATFWIDTVEVTTTQYKRCVDASSCPPADDDAACNAGKVGRELHPVNCVDWNQAGTYCLWAGKRLPSEAEWEKAARGTDGRIFPWGDSPPNATLLNWNDDLKSTTPVGTYPKGVSFYGIHNMGGNVSEWVADFFSQDYYDNSPSQNPPGPSEGSSRVTRGGSWQAGIVATAAMAAVRQHNSPTTQDPNIGFRCARTESP